MNTLRDSPHYPILIKLLKQYQDDPQSKVFAALADTYRKCGLYDEAIKIYQEGLNKNPDYVAAHVGYARCAYEMENYVLVTEILEKIISHARENIRALELLATSYEKLGNFQKAHDYFTTAYDLVPYDYRYLENINRLKDVLRLSAPKSQSFTKNISHDERFESDLRNWTLTTTDSIKSSGFKEEVLEEKKAEEPLKSKELRGNEIKNVKALDEELSSKEKKLKVLESLLDRLDKR